MVPVITHDAISFGHLIFTAQRRKGHVQQTDLTRLSGMEVLFSLAVKTSLGILNVWILTYFGFDETFAVSL